MSHPRDNSPEALEEFFQSGQDPYKYQTKDHEKRAETYVQLIAQHSGGEFVDRLLDVGCSEGYLTHILSESTNFAIGIDVSETAIKRALKNYEDLVDRGEMDFKCINFLKAGARKKFDVLVMTGVMPFFVDKWDDCLKRIDKLLRKGGLLVMSFVSTGCMTDPWISKLEGKLLERVDSREFTCNSLTHRAHVLRKK